MHPRIPAALVLTLLATACGTTSAPTTTPTITVTATVTVTPTPSTTAPVSTPPAPDEPTTETKTVTEEKALPNVVGMNLQEAQDTLQAAGFYYLDDQDATGQGRLQIFDRNWVVVRQTPPAGKRVPINTKVVLYAKKHEE